MIKKDKMTLDIEYLYRDFLRRKAKAINQRNCFGGMIEIYYELITGRPHVLNFCATLMPMDKK